MMFWLSMAVGLVGMGLTLAGAPRAGIPLTVLGVVLVMFFPSGAPSSTGDCMTYSGRLSTC